jgi:outer membrane biogenesis lipoprotein LolB
MDARQSTRSAPEVESALLGIVYELLDAHQDTVRLGDERADESLWQAHESYLRDLQRVSREALARITAGTDEIS